MDVLGDSGRMGQVGKMGRAPRLQVQVQVHEYICDLDILFNFFQKQNKFLLHCNTRAMLCCEVRLHSTTTSVHKLRDLLERVTLIAIFVCALNHSIYFRAGLAIYPIWIKAVVCFGDRIRSRGFSPP